MVAITLGDAAQAGSSSHLPVSLKRR